MAHRSIQNKGYSRPQPVVRDVPLTEPITWAKENKSE